MEKYDPILTNLERIVLNQSEQLGMCIGTLRGIVDCFDAGNSAHGRVLAERMLTIIEKDKA